MTRGWFRHKLDSISEVFSNLTDPVSSLPSAGAQAMTGTAAALPLTAGRPPSHPPHTRPGRAVPCRAPGTCRRRGSAPEDLPPGTCRRQGSASGDLPPPGTCPRALRSGPAPPRAPPPLKAAAAGSRPRAARSGAGPRARGRRHGVAPRAGEAGQQAGGAGQRLAAPAGDPHQRGECGRWPRTGRGCGSEAEPAPASGARHLPARPRRETRGRGAGE